MDQQRRMTRRDLLRSIGIAGAVAWAAPVLMSVPAGASTQRNLCKGVPGGPCGDYEVCGSCGTYGAYCFPKVNKDGTISTTTICGTGDVCGNLQACRVPSDCPKGYKCASTCCGLVCNQVCKTRASRPRQRPRQRPRLGKTNFAR